MKDGQGTLLEQGIKWSEEKKQDEPKRRKSIPELTMSNTKSPDPEELIPEEVKDYVEAKTSATALKYGWNKGLITDFEEREIFDYKNVYFIGKPGIDKMQATIIKQPNCGYDDERGDYQEVKGDHIAYRYEIKELLG